MNRCISEGIIVTHAWFTILLLYLANNCQIQLSLLKYFLYIYTADRKSVFNPKKINIKEINFSQSALIQVGDLFTMIQPLISVGLQGGGLRVI